MKGRKKLLATALMISSLALLVVLQFLWIRGSYHEVAENFKRESNQIFRTTMFGLHDELVARSIETVDRDSLRVMMRGPALSMDARSETDSVKRYVGVRRRTSQVEIILANPRSGDSVRQLIRPLMKRLSEGPPDAKSFIIRLSSDSIPGDSIRKAYASALADAGLLANFKIIQLDPFSNGEMRMLPPPGVFISEEVRLNPFNEYVAEFSDLQPFFLKKIAPQIFFCVVVTLLIVASFVVMYRNLRAQEKLMELKNDFISNITHELKTPVATVSVALEALKNFNVLENPARTEEYLSIAQNELGRLTLMTDKILKTTVFENQGMAYENEVADMDQLVQQVLSSMKLVFEKRKTQVTFERKGTDFRIRGGISHLTHVLYNLLDNALKYSQGENRIHVSLQSDDASLTLSVADNGIGIAPEYQKKIFEKFFRVPTGDVHNTKGYGLGLNYVASVVKSHGGTIDVESEPGIGSTFIVRIPKNMES